MSERDIAEQNLIYKVRTGSHAYGTNLPTSDLDYAGIFIPPLDYYFGLQAFDLLSEQGDSDKSYYSLRKYANLAVANNPNVLELLFVDNSDVLLSTAAAEELRRNKTLFLSQRCQKTFVGYAKAQLHRIRIHTKWLGQELEDMAILWPLIANEQVTRDWVAWRFGDNMLKRVDQEFTKQIRAEYESDLLRAAYNHFYKGTTLGNQEQLLAAFKSSSIVCPDKDDPRFFTSGGDPDKPTRYYQKHLYDEAKKKRDQYVTWMAERNPIRHETELQFGYDTKHAMHLVRLLRSGYEILTTGNLSVRRPDANELLSIRAGKWTYEEVTKYADEMVAQIDGLGLSQIKVPATPDINKINKMVVDITQEYLMGHGDHT